jgi:hypothetical protein
MLYNLLLSRLSPYINEIIGDHQCGFQWNSATSDEISFFHLPYTGEKMGVQQDNTSAIQRFQESL